MAFDYSTVNDVEGVVLPVLRGWEVSVALSALARADVLDETLPPDEPEFSFDVMEDDWPFEVELSDSDREYFGFRSPDPGRIPRRKLSDNEPWILTPEECVLIQTTIAELLAGTRDRRVDVWVFDRLVEHGFERVQAPAEIERCLQVFADMAAAGEAAGGLWSY